MRWIFGTECNIASGHWDVWGNAAGNWISTGIPCAPPAAYKWHHLTWEFKRNATQVTYVAFTLDGVKHYVNRTLSRQEIRHKRAECGLPDGYEGQPRGLQDLAGQREAHLLVKQACSPFSFCSRALARELFSSTINKIPLLFAI